MESMQAFLNWDFLTAMMSQSVYVLAVANTIGTLSDSRKLPFKVSRTIAALIASLMLTFYAAFKGGGDWGIGRVLETLTYAVILFCLSAGTNQTVLAVAQSFGAGRGAAAGPSDARPRGEWWASWY